MGFELFLTGVVFALIGFVIISLCNVKKPPSMFVIIPTLISLFSGMLLALIGLLMAIWGH